MGAPSEMLPFLVTCSNFSPSSCHLIDFANIATILLSLYIFNILNNRDVLLPNDLSQMCKPSTELKVQQIFL